MATIALGPVTMVECEFCDGLWLDASAFERVCAEQDAQAAVLHRTPHQHPARDHRVSYRPCVTCGTMMNRVNFARISGVVLDVCRSHGTFLDAGELQRIISFIQAGGLHRMRQREIEDLREERGRIQMLDARARRMARRSPDHGQGFSGGAEAGGLLFSDLISMMSEL